MSDSNKKKDSGWIGVILFLLFIVCGLAFMLPFNIWVNILIAIVVVGISVGGIIFAAASLDGVPKFQIPNFEYKINQTELTNEDSTNMSPWDYYTSLRHKSWDELSGYEKERIVLAANLILEECGTHSTLSELKEFLQTHLPEIPKPYPGGDGVLGRFREWQKERKVH